MNRPQISLRTMLEIVAAIAVVLALLFLRSTVTTDRYRLHSDGTTLLLLDTHTGEVWRKRGNGWNPSMKPVK